MSKVFLISLICLTSIICQAQEHLRFLNIPINGELNEFVDKLIKEKGFVKDKLSKLDKKHNPKKKVQKLKGTFNGIEECDILVMQHKKLKNVSSVTVHLPIRLTENDFGKIITNFQDLYGNPRIDSTFFSTYIWDIGNSYIKVIRLALPMCSIYFVDYTENEILKQEQQKKNEELLKKETIKEICGIPFGSSYEKAASVLEKKYGEPNYPSDANTIAYKNKIYADIPFDFIYFLFQSDGIHTYMNGCYFVIEEKTLSEAEDRLEWLHDKLSAKYKMISNTNSSGHKYYLGGTSPTDINNFGFMISIVEHDLSAQCPYSVCLMYGRYNYVNEEF